MAKFLHCRDAGFDCDAVVHGDTVEDILAQVRPHAREVHRVEVDDATARRLVTLVADA
jgi:predicted small metal-binding protein